jgi:hypothetical protein
MGEFLTGKRLKNKIVDIIEGAEKELTIVSPYITLHPYYQNSLDNKASNKCLYTTIIYRKGENYKKQPHLSPNDLEFLKHLKKVAIYANHHLHAKLYANESGMLVTSMNLYEFSQKNNNIEFGIYYPNGQFENRQDIKIRANIRQTVQKVLKGSELQFTNIPTIQDDLFSSHSANIAAQQINDMSVPPTEGYCIRTRIIIPFNISRPFCQKIYNEWSKLDYPVTKETYCHLTGEITTDSVSSNKPIAYSYWVLLRNKFPKFVEQLTETYQPTP